MTCHAFFRGAPPIAGRPGCCCNPFGAQRRDARGASRGSALLGNMVLLWHAALRCRAAYRARTDRLAAWAGRRSGCSVAVRAEVVFSVH
jgi:hypothetical protein